MKITLNAPHEKVFLGFLLGFLSLMTGFYFTKRAHLIKKLTVQDHYYVKIDLLGRVML